MRRVLTALAVLLLLALVVGAASFVARFRVGPDLPEAPPPPPVLRIHPHVAGPGATLTCAPVTPGAPVRWTIDGAPAGEGTTLVAPDRVGAVVTCASGAGGAGEVDRVVVGPGVVGGNLLLVILDDVGIDKVAPYEPITPAPTLPVIEGLAQQGVRFATAWTTPICSPTRAGLLTGLYPTNNGVGRVIDSEEADGLRPGVRTLPGLLREHGYATAAVGKWHVTGEPAGIETIHALGFDRFGGTWGNLHPPLKRYRWPLVDDAGRVRVEERYSDDVLVELAERWIEAQRGPWFLWLAFHGAHAPWDPPPTGDGVPEVAPDDPFPDRYDAVLQATDRALGRLIASLPDDVRAETTIVVMGDNGTADRGVRPPYVLERAKGTTYDLGAHVPLIVVGPTVPASARGTVATGFVSHVDVLPTLVELAAGDVDDDDARALDGVSFADLLVRPDLPARRDLLYTETFEPHDAPPPWRHMWERSVRDERWHLLSSLERPDELYDLTVDPLETHDLLADDPSPEVLAVADRLRARMIGFMTPKPAELIRPDGVPDIDAEPVRRGRRR